MTLRETERKINKLSDTMHTQAVTVGLDERAAKIYGQISAAERDKVNHLFSVLLSQHQQLPNFLSLLMDIISLRAQHRGLTGEELEKLLRDG
uniref:Uncharacterized protein n=1 Tax=Candidatus Kentrum sp. FW TaxID=2126338 RepID=A0A450U419_9GAMM|nr:MAG: hypothetical protein BECKFW1821C_GA0114237_11514 [Candidatus Kentron sp. FW]